MQLSIGDLIELAETGKTGNIELDSMAATVLHECLNMLKFEKTITKERRNKMQDRFRVRVWDIERKDYVYDAQFEPDYDVIEDDKKYIPEQCTGCRDCSNQLIYEGDILEIAEDMGTSHVVVYWDDEFQKWTIQGDTEADYEFYDLVKRPCDSEVIDDIGVVGNIHENPELLEDNK